MKTIRVIADDLSGAAESAIKLGAGTVVYLDSDRHRGVAVWDLETREMSSTEAFQQTRRWLANNWPTAALTVKKIDSLLRGNIRSELAALRPWPGPVIVCPALPDQGRIVRGGELLVDGIRLAETQMWALENEQAPGNIAEAVSSQTENVERICVDDLTRDLVQLKPDSVYVCDAETKNDLAVIASSAQKAKTPLLVGSSAIIEAIASQQRSQSLPSMPADSKMLFVLGTGSSVAEKQVEELRAAFPNLFCLDLAPGCLDSGDETQIDHWAVQAANALLNQDVVIRIFPKDLRLQPQQSLTAVLSKVVSAILDHVEDVPVLFAAGGEMAVKILHELGVLRLNVCQEIHPGAVVTASGPYVLVVRPGSHGDKNSLVQIKAALSNNSQ